MSRFIDATFLDYLCTDRYNYCRGHLRRSKAWVDFLEGTQKLLSVVRGVYLMTRFHELQFFIVYGNTKKIKKKKLIVFDILCPNILNIAWTIEQLNLKFKKKYFWAGAQKFMGAQKLLRGHDANASLRHLQMAPELLSASIVDSAHHYTVRRRTTCHRRFIFRTGDICWRNSTNRNQRPPTPFLLRCPVPL